MIFAKKLIFATTNLYFFTVQGLKYLENCIFLGHLTILRPLLFKNSIEFCIDWASLTKY